MAQEASEWTRFLTRANQLFRTTTHPAAVQLPVEGRMPSLDGATGWLNLPPLTAACLRRRVVLANVWTYTCINWLRQLPYIRAWAERYQDDGPVMLGVHTPEFDVDRGGHFAAWEQPELFSAELRAAFRSLRTNGGSS